MVLWLIKRLLLVVSCMGGRHTYPPKLYSSLIHQFPFPLNKILADSCFNLVFTPLNPVVVTVLSAFYWFLIGRHILSINVYQLFVDRDFFYRMTYVEVPVIYYVQYTYLLSFLFLFQYRGIQVYIHLHP